MALNDQKLLATDATFLGRVQAGLIGVSNTIAVEGWGVPFHRERATFAAQVLNNPSAYAQLFANVLATDTNCISDATQAGTVPLTSGNVATQAALVTDAHISAACGNYYNSFFRCPAN
jgi:hypothetical protein